MDKNCILSMSTTMSCLERVQFFLFLLWHYFSLNFVSFSSYSVGFGVSQANLPQRLHRLVLTIPITFDVSLTIISFSWLVAHSVNFVYTCNFPLLFIFYFNFFFVVYARKNIFDILWEKVQNNIYWVFLFVFVYYVYYFLLA